MRVVGLDPAPAKGGTVFDGEYRTLSPKLLGEFLAEVSSDEATLICWDSPLTGPREPDVAGSFEGDFTQRPIEKFFSRADYGFKTPSGISVLGYSGCPHWTISRAYLGLPRVGRWDRSKAELPFTLLTETRFSEACGQGPFVVEVHPAVAIWCWCVDLRPFDAAWTYKESVDLQEELADHIISRYSLDVPMPRNDDELDSLVAWLLGVRWISGNGDVKLYGNERVGTFLLPGSERLDSAFERFLTYQSFLG